MCALLRCTFWASLIIPALPSIKPIGGIRWWPAAVCLMDMIHAVYLAEWLVGEQAQQVMAFVDAPEYSSSRTGHRGPGPAANRLPERLRCHPHGLGRGRGRRRYQRGSDGQIRHALQAVSVGRLQSRGRAIQYRQRLEPQATTPSPICEQHMRQCRPLFYPALGKISAMPSATTASRSRRQRRAPARLEIVLGAYASAVTGQGGQSCRSIRQSPVYRLKALMAIAELEVWEQSKTKAAGLFGLREVRIKCNESEARGLLILG